MSAWCHINRKRPQYRSESLNSEQREIPGPCLGWLREAIATRNRVATIVRKGGGGSPPIRIQKKSTFLTPLFWTILKEKKKIL